MNTPESTAAELEAEAPDGEPLSNFDRLRAHLDADSLAKKLLDAYSASEPSATKTEMLKAVSMHFLTKTSDDDVADSIN
jgi:hypothetical protein